jgi:hypothetical protein
MGDKPRGAFRQRTCTPDRLVPPRSLPQARRSPAGCAIERAEHRLQAEVARLAALEPAEARLTAVGDTFAALDRELAAIAEVRLAAIAELRAQGRPTPDWSPCPA